MQKKQRKSVLKYIFFSGVGNQIEVGDNMESTPVQGIMMTQIVQEKHRKYEKLGHAEVVNSLRSSFL